METKQHATKKTNGSMRKSKKKSEFTSREMKLETQHSKIYGYSKSSSKKEIYSNTILPQQISGISNRQPNLTPKATSGRRTNKPKLSRRKEIIKIRAETNEIEMKK